jgi:hypothetical protein
LTATVPDHPPPRSRRWLLRRTLFALVVLTGLVLLCEGTARVTYWVLTGERFSFAQARHERHRVPDPAQEARVLEQTFPRDVHPYLGFSYDPDWRGKLEGEAAFTEWGFTDSRRRSPVRKRGPNKVVVGILGASVASIFSNKGVRTLARELKQSPPYAGKEIEFVSLSVGSFKQPQQLLALNYALAMGAEFDAILNIDGLNEIAWYRQDNGVSQVSHLYPLGWHWLVAKLPDRRSRRQVGKIAYLSERRFAWADTFGNGWLRRSATAHLIWRVGDRHFEAAINNTEAALRSQKNENLPYRARGPRNTFRNDDELLDELVADWERCSLLIDRICQSHGIRYDHFLQPNQYDKGSKPLSAVEQRIAYWDKMPARPLIEKGYPRLRKAGQRLAQQGVRFHDLSRVFAQHEETFYFDNCCHFNRQGNEVMAVAIAKALLQTPEPPLASPTVEPLSPSPRPDKVGRP